MTFDEFVARAAGTGVQPYDYQRSIAEHGFPELLSVPTGAGKTMAAVLPWLYRRRFHPDPLVRGSTPHRLVFVLPMRVLVEQTTRVTTEWLNNLGLGNDVTCEVLMGGERRRSEWRLSPERDAILIGTLDMILSRALNRGYGESRYLWPIDFGLLNASCHFVFDEVQLMGPALATSRQLHGLRTALGVGHPCSSMWMSATVPEEQLTTVDAPAIATRVALSSADRASPELGRRLNGRKTIIELAVADPKKPEQSIAAALDEHHRAGTLSMAIMNTVDRARTLHKELAKIKPEAALLLLHSRFRPLDRAALVERALSAVDPTGPGLILVSTQVVEAGVDISAATLLTEAAPWPSIVQRAGRCNRLGELDDARLLWVEPPKALPYNTNDVAASVEQLRSLDGQALGPEQFAAQQVGVEQVITPVLRRRDLLQLFDTQPDLSGNDIDVSRFIRDADDLDVAVAWRPIGAGRPPAELLPPGRNERCAVPITELRDVLKNDDRIAWRWSHLDARWERCIPNQLRPGELILVDSSFGCYAPETGWDRTSRAAVEPVAKGLALVDDDADLAADDDPESLRREWLELGQHLADVEVEARTLFDALPSEGCPPSFIDAAVTAARFHDLGKAHFAFQQMLRSTTRTEDEEALCPEASVHLAKSGGSGRGHYDDKKRRYFRHELASTLALLGEWAPLLEATAEPDLVLYLVASHHGRVRMVMRSLPKEENGQILGVFNGDQVPATPAIIGSIGPATLSLGASQLGSDDGSPSWLQRTAALRDRMDLGPFRLGYLEAVVRLADWRASAAPGASNGNAIGRTPIDSDSETVNL